MNKRPADYLGKRYYPEYRGACYCEFPHMCIVDSHRHGTIICRMHFSPDRFEEAWEEACQQADLLNQEPTKLRTNH